MKTDVLLERYPVRIREVTIGVILLISLIFYSAPRFLGESEKIEYNTVQEIETFDIPQTQQATIPPPPPEPEMPLPAEDEDISEDITIDDTDFDTFDEWDAPPPMAEGPKVVFIPYDEPPTPKRGLGIKPKYPSIAQEASMEGKVYVQFFIDKNGNVTEAWILNGGLPGTGFNEAALEAVKRSKWNPAVQRDKNVGVWQTVPVVFQLH